jgi:hypothetical protein
MSVFKTTFSRALKVIPSDNCNVPSPNLLVSSANTSYDGGNPDVLTDNSVAFVINVPSQASGSSLNKQYLVNVGDVVYCYDTALAATILKVIDKFNLLLNADIFGGVTGLTYYIYQEGAQTGLGNTGAYLYIGGPQNEGDIHVTTIGGDDMLFGKITKPFFPIQVKKVWLTGTDISVGDLYAVW